MGIGWALPGFPHASPIFLPPLPHIAWALGGLCLAFLMLHPPFSHPCPIWHGHWAGFCFSIILPVFIPTKKRSKIPLTSPFYDSYSTLAYSVLRASLIGITTYSLTPMIWSSSMNPSPFRLSMLFKRLSPRTKYLFDGTVIGPKSPV